MSVQSLGNKENKDMVQNQLKYFTKGSLVYPCTVNVIPLYSDKFHISSKLYVHVGVLIMFSMV